MTKQSGIFTDEQQGLSEFTCINFLLEHGYVVIKLGDLDTTNVETAKDLVAFFYSNLLFYNKDRKLHYGKSTKKDLKMAASFIGARRKDTGLPKKRAAQECASIIRCVISNENKFNFSSPINNMDCFGQESMRWVTDRAISIINGEAKKLQEEQMDEYMTHLYSIQEKQAIDEINDDRIKELSDALAGLVNGNEKNSF